MKLTKDIQNKILEASINFKTDSDIEAFSEENRISFDDVLRVLLNNIDEYMPCHGCLYIVNRAYSLIGTVCENCSRANKVEDLYVTDLRYIDEVE